MLAEHTLDASHKAKDALSSSPYHQLRRLEVHCDRQHVTISGRVSSFHLRQLAQATVRKACFPLPICDNIEVDNWQIAP